MSSQWTPDSPLRQECWPEFQKLHAVIWDQLVFLHTSLFLFRQFAQFPVRFLHPDDHWYLAITGRALLDSIILGVSRLTTDQAGDLLTLPRFRNLVLKMLRDEATEQFRRDLKATSFEPSLTALAEDLRELRDGRVAHLRLEDISNGSALSLALPGLERLVAETERLFTPLLFGGEAKLIPPIYDPQVRKTNRPWVTDYEAVLNALARKSHVLRYPEDAADLWPEVRKEWSAEDVEELNVWRRRIGLPEA